MSKESIPQKPGPENEKPELDETDKESIKLFYEEIGRNKELIKDLRRIKVTIRQLLEAGDINMGDDLFKLLKIINEKIDNLEEVETRVEKELDL